jgi:two-component system, LuxR family, response regulator FixJ
LAIMVEIIDDDDAVRDSTKALLESYGYEVCAHASAEHFLADKGLKPDCLLVDHHMPGMTGLDLLELLRARGDSTPALMMTGRSDPSLEPRASRVGAALLHKPVPEDELVRWIERTKKTKK